MSARYHNTAPSTRSNRTGRTNGRDPFWDLVATARHLQAPGGCRWDRAQTVSSLLPYLVEETWEVFEAVRRRRLRDLQEELGDVLYTVLFLSLIAERRGRFTLEELLTATRTKMIRRHPHVFGTKKAGSPQAAYRRWQESKRLERKRSPSPSKTFRELLVARWAQLLDHPEAMGWKTISGRPTTPSATPRRRKARSPGRARSWVRED
jgi:uncharacterized protein YabN with tetrapyrrole methylase and pyrophosphatase domain